MQLDAREDVCIFRGVRRIPVYLMDDDRLGTRENSFIPDGCPCVFVNARSIDAILDGFGIGPRTQLSAYSEYERASVYATVLIHEVGHLNNGDARSYAEPLVLTSAEIEPTVAAPDYALPDGAGRDKAGPSAETAGGCAGP